MGCRRGPAQQELTERKGNGVQVRRERGGEECSDLSSLVLPLPASGQTKPEARGRGSPKMSGNTERSGGLSGECPAHHTC